MEDIKLKFREQALKAIAKKAIQRKTGARGLRAIIENILLKSMFELPGTKNVSEIVIDKNVIDEAKDPIIIYSKGKK
ncbi:MAG: ATP-dependent Clp protease ATP-binding subunit ClpX, partial [Epsilonproteobacteria bacterium]|nr:ATP-dependent Clp protease ATP-binding subunit ClpX [Campylobacterota bacterium]